MSIFPAAVSAAQRQETLPLAKEVNWDYEKNRPIFRGGEPVYVTGKDAVAVWCWKALHTPRFSCAIYSRNYGLDSQELIGRAYTDLLKQAVAARCVQDCLRVSRYVTSVSEISVEFSGSSLHVSCMVRTIYGSLEVDTDV